MRAANFAVALVAISTVSSTPLPANMRRSILSDDAAQHTAELESRSPMEMPNLSWGHLKGRLMGNKPTLESQYSSTPFFRVETDEALQSPDKPAVFEMQHMPPEPANAHVPVRKPFFDRTGLALGGAATTVVGGGLGVLWWDYFAQKKLRRQCRRDRTPKKCARFQRG